MPVRALTPRLPYPAADSGTKNLRSCGNGALSTTATAFVRVRPANGRRGGNIVINVQAVGTDAAIAGGKEAMGAPVFDNDVVVPAGQPASFDLTGDQDGFRIIGQGTGRYRWWIG